MRKHLFYLSMALVADTVVSACGGGKKGVFTPTSSGRAYEVLVVVEKPGLWERPAGRALCTMCLILMCPGLPQSERSFRIMYTSPSQIMMPSLKLIRNIIIVDVIYRIIYTQPKFKYAKECICRSSV